MSFFKSLKDVFNKAKSSNNSSNTPASFTKQSNSPITTQPIIAKPEVQLNQIYILNKSEIGKLKTRFIAFDFETTGLSCYHDRVIQIGATVFENLVEVANFTTYVKTTVPISIEAFLVNGITEKTLENAPNEYEALCKFSNFLGNALSNEVPLVAYNAEFDINFLYNMLIRNGFSAQITYIDTLYLSKLYIYKSQNYKQSTIAQKLGININEAHEALDDSRVCGNILCKLISLEESPPETSSLNVTKLNNGLTVLERGICSYVIKLFKEHNFDLSYLMIKKQSNNFVSFYRPYKLFEFRAPQTKKTYFIIQDRYYIETNLEEEFYKQWDEGFIKKIYINSLEDIIHIFPSFEKAYKYENKELKYFLKQHFNEELFPDNYSVSDFSIELDIEKCQNEINMKLEKEKEKIQQKEESKKRTEERKTAKEEKNNNPIKPQKRPIAQYDDGMNLIAKYESVSDAASAVGVSTKGIREVAKGRQKHAAGFIWKYLD